MKPSRNDPCPCGSGDKYKVCCATRRTASQWWTYIGFGAFLVAAMWAVVFAISNSGKVPEGMVWNALKKGYRLGTITSSDHGSTHISYALVYTPKNDREEILDSIRKRHTYGSTDNLIVEFWANGHFMGEEFTPEKDPELLLRAKGTTAIAKVDLVRNNEYIYSATPDKAEVEIKYVDMKPEAGLNYYYFRIRQENGEVAWTSPVWLTYKTD